MPCPWDSLQQTTLEFCEENLCAWIKEPANTWSNLLYLFIGIFIWRNALSHRRYLLSWMGVVSFLTGIGSGLYHASGVYWAGVADYLAMFLGTGAMTALNVRRWLKWNRARLYIVFAATTSLLILLMLVMPGTERLLYFLAMPCCAIELRLFFKEGSRTRYRNYLCAWLMVALGVLFWWLDISQRWCPPSNHWLNGHAIWHIATALAFYFFYRYYLQFTELVPRAAQSRPGND